MSKKKTSEEVIEEQVSATEETVKETADETTKDTEAVTDDAIDPKKVEYARIMMRKQFNERFSKWAEIDPEDSDDDFIKQASEEFDNAVKEQTDRSFMIGSHVDGVAEKTVDFLLEFNATMNTWDKGGWRGLVMFEKVMKPIAEEIKKDSEKDLCIDYSTLIFLYESMMAPHGCGLESAKLMAKYENYNIETDKPYEEDTPVTYSGVLSKILDYIKELRLVDKKLNIMKQRRDLAYAGLKMNLKIDSLEEFSEFNDALTNANVPEDDEEFKKTLAEANE